MLGRIQDLFGTPESDTSLTHSLTDFQMAVESLAAAPQSELQQRDVVRAGAETADLFRRYSAGIQNLRAEADQRIGKAVDEINRLLTKIADLNDKVLRNGAMGQSVADLEDTRDQAIDRLSQLIDIRAVQRGKGDVVVFTTGGRTLVDGTAATLTHNPAATASASMSYAAGRFRRHLRRRRESRQRHHRRHPRRRTRRPDRDARFHADRPSEHARRTCRSAARYSQRRAQSRRRLSRHDQPFRHARLRRYGDADDHLRRRHRHGAGAVRRQRQRGQAHDDAALAPSDGQRRRTV